MPSHEIVEICTKALYQVELSRTNVDQMWGFSVEAELVENMERQDELCVFVSRVEDRSVAMNHGKRTVQVVVVLYLFALVLVAVFIAVVVVVVVIIAILFALESIRLSAPLINHRHVFSFLDHPHCASPCPIPKRKLQDSVDLSFSSCIWIHPCQASSKETK